MLHALPSCLWDILFAAIVEGCKAPGLVAFGQTGKQGSLLHQGSVCVCASVSASVACVPVSMSVHVCACLCMSVHVPVCVRVCAYMWGVSVCLFCACYAGVYASVVCVCVVISCVCRNTVAGLGRM